MSKKKSNKVMLEEIRQTIRDMQFTYSCNSVPAKLVSPEITQDGKSMYLNQAMDKIVDILGMRPANAVYLPGSKRRSYSF